MPPQLLPLADAEPLVPTPVLAKKDTIVTVISTVSNSAAPSTSAAAPVQSKPQVGTIVGGLIGGIAAGLVLTAFIFWFVRYRKNKKETERQILEKRRKRLEAKYRGTAFSSASSSSSHARLNPSISGMSGMSEKSVYDPNVAIPSPMGPYSVQDGSMLPYHAAPAQQMPYMVPNGVQTPYAQQHQQQQPTIVYVPVVVNDGRPDMANPMPYSGPSPPSSDSGSSSAGSSSAGSSRTSGSSSRRKSVPSLYGSTTSGGSNSNRNSRGASRAAKADMAAAAATAPLSARHRPIRPSPLASSSERVPQSSALGGGPVPGPSPSVSPPSSSDGCSQFTSSPGTSTPSSTEDAYAAAAGGSWGMVSTGQHGHNHPQRGLGNSYGNVETLGVEGMDFSAPPPPSEVQEYDHHEQYQPQQQTQQTLQTQQQQQQPPPPQHPLYTVRDSSQYSLDPFAEYHMYEQALDVNGDHEEELASHKA